MKVLLTTVLLVAALALPTRAQPAAPLFYASQDNGGGYPDTLVHSGEPTLHAADLHLVGRGFGPEAVADLFQNPLAEAFEQSFEVAAEQPAAAIFQAPDSRQVPLETIGNRFTFQGRPQDPETGFYYFRNRYYDPELGRFTTPDPLGYLDGPSVYAFAGYSPFDTGVPLGLCLGLSAYPGHCSQYRQGVADWIASIPKKKRDLIYDFTAWVTGRPTASYRCLQAPGVVLGGPGDPDDHRAPGRVGCADRRDGELVRRKSP